MRRLIVLMTATQCLLLFAQEANAQSITCDDTLKVRIETGSYTGSTSRFRFELTTSALTDGTDAGTDYVQFLRYSFLDKRQDNDVTYGGPVKANLFGGWPWGPNQAWLHSRLGFYNAYYVDIDSLENVITFDFRLFDVADTAGHASEFSVHWMYYPNGNPDESVDIFQTEDPTPGNSLFAVTAWNDSCELAVFYPAVFIAPDSIVVPDSLLQVGIVDSNPLLTQLRVLGAYPNPARAGIAVAYETAVAEHVEFCVFDIQGKVVFRTRREHSTPGEYVFEWNGTSVTGRRVASGVYFAQVRNQRKAVIRKIVMLR